MKIVPFKQYIAEEDSYAIVRTGINSRGVDNPVTRQALNSALAKTCAEDFLTPYIALGAISKVLAYANIILPQYVFLDKESGEVVFDAHQFGGVEGIGKDMEKTTHKASDSFYVYFCYDMDATGYYDVWAAVVDALELEAILSAPDDHDDSWDDAIENGPMQAHEKTEEDGGPPKNPKV